MSIKVRTLTQSEYDSLAQKNTGTLYITDAGNVYKGEINAFMNVDTLASSQAAGLMSPADKTKLDNVEENAEVNIIESVKWEDYDGETQTNHTLTVAQKSVSLPVANGSSGGIVTKHDYAKFSDAYNKALSNKTRTDALSGIDGIVRCDGDGGFSAAAVATSDIADGAVTGDKLADDAVYTNNIVNYSITGQKLDDEIIKDTHVADDANIKLSKTKKFNAARLHANLDGSVGVGSYTDNIENHFTDHALAATWHAGNTSIHITPSERTSWNGAVAALGGLTFSVNGATGILTISKEDEE